MGPFSFFEKRVGKAEGIPSERGGVERVQEGEKPDYSQERLLKLAQERDALAAQLTGKALLDVALHPGIFEKKRRLDREIEELEIAMQAAAWSEGADMSRNLEQK